MQIKLFSRKDNILLYLSSKLELYNQIDYKCSSPHSELAGHTKNDTPDIVHGLQ